MGDLKESLEEIQMQLNLLVHHCQNSTIVDSAVVRQFVYRLEDMFDELIKRFG